MYTEQNEYITQHEYLVSHGCFFTRKGIFHCVSYDECTETFKDKSERNIRFSIREAAVIVQLIR